MNKLGIDFGTSFCSMCYYDEKSGRPELIRDSAGLEKIPSVVYWGKTGVTVGQAAVRIFADSSDMPDDERADVQGRIFKSIKRRFIPDRVITLPDGQTIMTEDIVVEILKYLKKQAESRAFNGERVSSATLTHPVAFTHAQKELLKKAAQKAGFEEIVLLEEPIAAAFGFSSVASHAGRIGENILVYDLGGGTLDIALVHRTTEGEYHIPIEPIGDARCGGDDFDDLLYTHFETLYKQKNQTGFCEDPNRLDLNVLFKCQEFKERLSQCENINEAVKFSIYSERIRLKEELSRSGFECMIRDKVAHSIKLLERMLASAKESGYPVDTVLLIGGSSRIPLIAEMLRERLPVKPLETMHDDVAVAKGAALAGDAGGMMALGFMPTRTYYMALCVEYSGETRDDRFIEAIQGNYHDVGVTLSESQVIQAIKAEKEWFKPNLNGTVVTFLAPLFLKNRRAQAYPIKGMKTRKGGTSFKIRIFSSAQDIAIFPHGEKDKDVRFEGVVRHDFSDQGGQSFDLQLDYQRTKGKVFLMLTVQQAQSGKKILSQSFEMV